MEYHRFYHTANLTNGTGQVTDIVLTPSSLFFLARPVYGAGGNDPALAGFTIHRYIDWLALNNLSSNTPSISFAPSGSDILIVQNYNQENNADFGFFGIFKRNGRVGIASRASSLSPEIRGIEIYEYPFG